MIEITHIAYKEQPSVKHVETAFLSENLDCDKPSVALPALQVQYLPI